MAQISAATFLAWCTCYTLGIALLVCRVPMLIPFGIAFSCLGIAPFVSARLVAGSVPLFIVVLGISLLSIIQGLHFKDGIPSEWPKPSLWDAGILTCVWGGGILFMYRRWRSTSSPRRPSA